MNAAPKLSHRSSSTGLPENLAELSDTIILATERIRAVSLIVEHQLTEHQTMSNENIAVVLDSISQEAADIDSWLRWWLEKTRNSESS